MLSLDFYKIENSLSDEEKLIQHSAAAQIDFLMPDVFHVNRIGISDTVCIEIDDCPVFSAPPPIVRFATQVVQGWAELINVEAGDQLTFSLTNATTDRSLARRGQCCRVIPYASSTVITPRKRGGAISW